MNGGTIYEQGDILLVPFPFSDLSESKKRPVLVLSKDKAEDILIRAVTSNTRPCPNSIVVDNHDLIFGTLASESRIRVDKLFTLDKCLALHRIGRISLEKLEMVKQVFRNLV